MVGAPAPRRRILCLGNPLLGDDGVAWAVADLLPPPPPPGVEIVRIQGHGTALLDHLVDLEAALVVDACPAGLPPGKVALATSPTDRSGPRAAAAHLLPHNDVIQVATALGNGPPRVCWLLIGIAGPSSWGGGLSPSALRGARLAARWIRRRFFQT